MGDHHAFASSAKLSSKWWEFDIDWLYISVLDFLGLAKVKKLAPKPKLVPDKIGIDADTLRAVITNRLYVMSDYTKKVIARVYQQELHKADKGVREILKPIRGLLTREDSLVTDDAKRYLDPVLELTPSLEVVYEFKLRLRQIWEQRTAIQENLLNALQEWCCQAEKTGIKALDEFAQSLRRYSLQAGPA